jgi:hypothetical protein
MEVLHEHQWVWVSNRLVLRSCEWTASLFLVVLVQKQSGLARLAVALVQHQIVMTVPPDLCGGVANVGVASTKEGL